MKIIMGLISLGSLLLLSTLPLYAHGGGELIAGPVPVGAYAVYIWLNPPDPRATEAIHFTVGVAAPDDRQPILDAQIVVEMRAKNDGSLIVSAPVTTEQSVNKLFYETDIEVATPGLYEAVFFVSGTDGEGSITVDVEVGPPSKINWLMIGLSGLGVIVILGWWRSRKPFSETKKQK